MDEKKRAPKLRFKGFTDDWEQRKLGDLVNFYGGLTYHPEDIRDNGTFIIRSSNIKDGQLVTKDNIFVNPKVVNSSYVKKGDIIVVVRNGSRSLIGKHTKLNFSLDNAVIGAFMTGIRSNNTDFINALFDSDNYKKEIQKNLGATINQITTGNFKKMQFYIPSLIDEKINLGSLIRIIDNLLVLQQRKLNQLKLLKKAMFQQLFIDNMQPKLRFKGFTNNWSYRKLGDISKSYSGGTPSINQKKYYGGSIPFIRSAEINKDKTELYLTNAGLNNSSAKLVNKGDILYALYGATSGNASLSKINGAINQAVLDIRPTKKFSSLFIVQWLKYNRNKLISKYLQGGQGNFSGKIIKNITINLPSLQEQQQIGTLFNELDKIILLQKNRIENCNFKLNTFEN